METEETKIEEVIPVAEVVETPTVEVPVVETNTEVVESIVVGQDYTNEYRVYVEGSIFKSFATLEEAQVERDTNGGTIAVASVK